MNQLENVKEQLANSNQQSSTIKEHEYLVKLDGRHFDVVVHDLEALEPWYFVYWADGSEVQSLTLLLRILEQVKRFEQGF